MTISSKKTKTPTYRVYYSVLVNGNEYPRVSDFSAETSREAEKALDEIMIKFPEISYKIHNSEKIS
jgi:hypothetical protein